MRIPGSFLLLAFTMILFLKGFPSAASEGGTKDSALALYQKIQKSDSNEVRDSLGRLFDRQMRSLLEQKNAFKSSFPKLGEQIGILYAPDRSFRLFNWNIAYTNGTHAYFAYILRKRENGDPELIELEPMRGPSDRNKKSGGGMRKRELERKDLQAGEWLPALYYRIIRKERNGKAFYTLLGWEGKDQLTTRKLIEVLRFDEKGRPKFGLPVFKKAEKEQERESWREKERKRRRRTTRAGRKKERPKERIIFEYTDDAVMSLRYEKEKDRIVFNQLVPERPDLEGMYEFYGPDLLFNAYAWEAKYWVFKKKVKPENQRSRTQKWNDPEE
ncbi:MAG: hypothetical protein ABEH38_00055 [Flavobacteriales bacterium]